MKSIVLPLLLAAYSLAAQADPPPGHAPIDPATLAAMQSSPIPPLNHEAKVLSAINVGVYTYVEVQEGRKTQWIAAQALKAAKGDTILFDEGAPMTDFYSKTLDRTFPTITFVSNAGVCHVK